MVLFRVVCGVLPRNFPGVLKTSRLCLPPTSVMNARAFVLRDIDILPVFGEDIGHVFVEPFQLIAHREAEVLQFLCHEIVRLVSLLQNPLR
jgi:hypothetical protein